MFHIPIHSKNKINITARIFSPLYLIKYIFVCWRRVKASKSEKKSHFDIKLTFNKFMFEKKEKKSLKSRKFICIWCCLWELRRKKNISVSRNYINSLKAAIISLSLVVHFPMCESRELFPPLSFAFILKFITHVVNARIYNKKPYFLNTTPYFRSYTLPRLL